mgnify:CR=1 FL=1
MRTSTLAVLVLMASIAVPAALALDEGTPASAGDQQFFEQHANDIVKIKADALENPALGKVLTGKFFSLNITIGGGGEKVVAARMGDKAIPIALPDTDADMPDFAKLVKPGFTLKTDADAHALQDAFDVLYPVDKDDASVKTIRHSGNTWTFIRAKFFDHFDGLIVTTDGSGKITDVKRSLEVK